MFLYLCAVILIHLSFAKETVKFAAIIYRHGDRTPVDPYPTDPWRNESLWPVRFGELTNIGKRQHYELGVWLRMRYSNLISEDFDPKEVYIRSTDVDRALMSAQVNLAGMYSPTGKSVWNINLLWQPIPVHTKPEKDDEVLAMKKDCPAYNKEKKRYKNSKSYKERLGRYENLMKYLTANTNRTIRDYEDINDIYNNLYIENLYNFTLPSWTKFVYPDKLMEPACYSFSTSTATPQMARLMVGPLFKDIVQKMKNIISDKTGNPLKMAIYSGHDFTIGNILSAMGLFDGKCPPYTATVFLELVYDNSTAAHYVRFSYRNSTEIVEPNLLFIPHCGKTCKIERFIKLYDNLLNVNWEQECEKNCASIIGLSLLFVTSLLFSLYAVYSIPFVRVYRQRRVLTNYAKINSNGNKESQAMETNGNAIMEH